MKIDASLAPCMYWRGLGGQPVGWGIWRLATRLCSYIDGDYLVEDTLSKTRFRVPGRAVKFMDDCYG